MRQEVLDVEGAVAGIFEGEDVGGVVGGHLVGEGRHADGGVEAAVAFVHQCAAKLEVGEGVVLACLEALAAAFILGLDGDELGREGLHLAVGAGLVRTHGRGTVVEGLDFVVEGLRDAARVVTDGEEVCVATAAEDLAVGALKLVASGGLAGHGFIDKPVVAPGRGGEARQAL